MLIRIPRYENFRNSVDFSPGTENLYAGNVESGTQATLTDIAANWTVNEWKDKIVKVYKHGSTDFYFGVVESNTENTLTFDDEVAVLALKTDSTMTITEGSVGVIEF